MEKMKLNIQLFGLTTTLTASATSTTDETAITTNQNYINLAIRVQTTKPTWNGEKGAYYQVTTTSQNNGTQTGSKYYFSIGSSTGSGDKTFNVTLGPFDHNPDGTLNDVSISVYVRITSSTTTTKTASVAMGTIPRASQPSLVTWPETTYDITMGEEIYIHMNRVSPSFTHSVYYNFGSLTNQLIATNVTYNCQWTPPLEMANQIPSSTSGVGSVLVKTYDGSTYIGEKSVSFRASVPSSVVPSASFTRVVEAGDVPASWGIYVKNKSRIGLTLSGSVAYSSPISGYRISYYGGAVTTASATTSYLTQAGSTTFTGQVTDTRGRSASTTITINVVDYSNPTISTAQVQRCDANGNIDNNGEYMYISYGASISSCSNKNTPSAVYKVGYRVHNTGNYTYVNLTTNANSYSANGMLFSDGIKAASASGTKVQFSTSNTYDIQFYVRDYFMEYTNLQSLDAGFDLMNFNASGKAMAIGKVSEAGANEAKLEVAVPTTMNDLLTMNTPTNSYSGAVIYAGTNHNEASISYMNNTNTKGYVLGYGTGGNDGMGIWSHETGQNVFKVNKSGDGEFANSVKTSNYYLGNDNLTSILGNLVGHYSYQADMNNALSPGIYSYYAETLNKPSNFATYGMYFVVKTDAWLYQIAFANWGTPRIATRVSVDNGSTWTSWDNMGDTGWQLLATSSNFESYSWGQLRYRKLNGVVTIVGVVKALVTTGWLTLVANLPDGFRPPMEYNVVCRTSRAEVMKLVVNEVGEIWTLDTSAGTYLQPNDNLEIAVTYIAA